MTITNLDQSRRESVSSVTAQSDLAAPVFYHWYVDGVWRGKTISPRRGFGLVGGDQHTVEVIETTDPDFDPYANPPSGYPARIHVRWIRSPDENIREYCVYLQKDGGTWEHAGTVYHDRGRYQYVWRSPRLEDWSEYAVRVTAVDQYGNESDAIETTPIEIVRTPDAPAISVTYDDQTQLVTFDEVSP